MASRLLAVLTQMSSTADEQPEVVRGACDGITVLCGSPTTKNRRSHRVSEKGILSGLKPKGDAKASPDHPCHINEKDLLLLMIHVSDGGSCGFGKIK